MTQVHAEVSIATIVADLNSLAQKGTQAASSCNQKERATLYKVDLSGDPSQYHKEVQLSSGPSNDSVEFEGDTVSVLTEDEAQKLFDEFSQIEYMKFDYLHDGCFARAHEFALIAKNHGIEMGKVFVSDRRESASLYPKEWKDSQNPPVPNGFVGWRYHVAPYVMVKKGDQLVPITFDVGVAKGPKPVRSWKEDMISSHPEDYDVIYRDRRYIFESGRSSSEGSNIAGQFEDQQLMRELGVDEFLFRREQGWL